MAPGSEAIVYLSSAPNQRFRGKVQGIGWAVKPEGEIDLPPSGVPYVKRELNWVRVAQRFPGSHRSRKSRPRSFSHGRVRGRDYQRSAALNNSHERRRFVEARPIDSVWFLAGSSANWRRRRARNQNSHHGRWRGFMRDHFDGAPGAGAVCHRLHGLSSSRRRPSISRHLLDSSDLSARPSALADSPALQVHLWLSRTAHSRNGDRALSRNVVVPRFCARATRIPHRLCCRCLAVRRRSRPLT